jgi:hypothetical protein
MAEHARLSASSAHRWTHCPGSARAGSGTSSAYADEGTRAHALAEEALFRGRNADLAAASLGIDDAEMIQAVQVYLDECEAIMARTGGAFLVEQRVSLADLNPPEPMFGTCDFLAYDRDNRTLYVRDLKYGKGVRVEADGNVQLRYYALGALLSMGADAPVSVVNAGIVQPRQDDPVRLTEFDVVELLEWGAWLIDRAREAARPDAPVRAGTWCRFCPASGTCAARAADALAAAQQEFAVAVASPAALSPPMVDLLTAEQVGALLRKADVLEDWLRDLRAAAHQAIERGVHVPGWKLVPKRAVRRWRNSEDAAQALERALPGVGVFERTLISPAAAEKHLAEWMRRDVPALTATAAKKSAADWLAVHVEQVSSGTTLAPDDDPRPALPAAGEEFFLPGTTENA